jgi:hypothetical protein
MLAIAHLWGLREMKSLASQSSGGLNLWILSFLKLAIADSTTLIHKARPFPSGATAVLSKEIQSESDVSFNNSLKAYLSILRT